MNRRDRQHVQNVIEAALLVALLSVLVWFARPSIGHTSTLDRVYPYAELSYHYERGLSPRPWASLGVPMSVGRFAPSIAVGIPLQGNFAVGLDVRLRYKLRH